MADVVAKVDFKNTEADQASTNEDLAGAPQPGDPLFQNGAISASDHMQGLESSGIPVATLNKVGRRNVWLYDTYANALAFATAGLIDTTTLVKEVDRLTGLAAAQLTAQVPIVNFHESDANGNVMWLDNNGDFVYAIDDNAGAGRTVFAMTTGGRQNGPIAITV